MKVTKRISIQWFYCYSLNQCIVIPHFPGVNLSHNGVIYTSINLYVHICSTFMQSKHVVSLHFVKWFHLEQEFKLLWFKSWYRYSLGQIPSKICCLCIWLLFLSLHRPLISSHLSQLILLKQPSNLCCHTIKTNSSLNAQVSWFKRRSW